MTVFESTENCVCRAVNSSTFLCIDVLCIFPQTDRVNLAHLFNI